MRARGLKRPRWGAGRARGGSAGGQVTQSLAPGQLQHDILSSLTRGKQPAHKHRAIRALLQYATAVLLPHADVGMRRKPAGQHNCRTAHVCLSHGSDYKRALSQMVDLLCIMQLQTEQGVLCEQGDQ